METAPTSIEVLLRPTQSQSDEPSDFTWFSEPHKCIQHLAVPRGHPSNYKPGPTLLCHVHVGRTEVTIIMSRSVMRR